MKIELPHDLTDERLADELRARGWRCEKDDGEGWHTLAALSRKIGRHSNYLAKTMSRGFVPPGLEITRAAAGLRRSHARPSAEFFRWAKCRQSPNHVKKPNQRRKSACHARGPNHD